MARGALGGQVWACGWCSTCTGPACTLSPVWGLAGGLGGWGASCPGLTLVQVPGDEMCCASWPREGGLGAFQCLVVAKESPLTRKPWKAETWPLGWRVEATVNPGLVGEQGPYCETCGRGGDCQQKQQQAGLLASPGRSALESWRTGLPSSAGAVVGTGG